ncbi:MAG: prepilin peptidase [Eubacterium sp.]|nr:prepilin peptidase [Eubacterium sp.]
MTGVIAYDVVMCIIVFIFGTVIGSFLNVVIYRTPLHMSIVTGPSHCTTCGTRIKPYDLVPIISWCLLGGKCRACKAKISARYTIVEALTGVLFLLAYIRFSLSLMLPIAIILFGVLVVLSFIDLDHMQIPYWCTVTVAVLGVINILLNNLLDTPSQSNVWWVHLLAALICAVITGLLALLGGLGGGDFQLMTAAALLLGIQIVPAAFIGIILGAIYGIIVKIRTKNTVKEKTAAVTDAFLNWFEEHEPETDKIIMGEYEEGKCRLTQYVFKGKSLEEAETDKALEESFTEIFSDIPHNNEYIFRIATKDGTLDKLRLQRRIAFGPALSVGIVIGMLYGYQILSVWLNITM